MKNIQLSEPKIACSYCHEKGYFTSIPHHAIFYNTCPLCYSSDYIDGLQYSCTEFHKYVIENCIDNDTDNFNVYKFCPECKIVYEPALSSHAKNHSSEHATFISKWKYKDEIYIGMPQFDTIEEWFHEINNIVVLETITPNKDNICSVSNYSRFYCPSLYKTD